MTFWYCSDRMMEVVWNFSNDIWDRMWLLWDQRCRSCLVECSNINKQDERLCFNLSGLRITSRQQRLLYCWNGCFRLLWPIYQKLIGPSQMWVSLGYGHNLPLETSSILSVWRQRSARIANLYCTRKFERTLGASGLFPNREIGREIGKVKTKLEQLGRSYKKKSFLRYINVCV